MTFETRYGRYKTRLLNEASICPENRKLFKEFFEYQEYKLKRMNGLAALDDGTYRTLYKYCQMLKNTNEWFRNKPWHLLTLEEIKQVYDDIEDHKIKTQRGGPVLDKRSYYSKVFKGKPFKLAGVDHFAKQVIEFQVRDTIRQVRFVEEEEFRKLISVLCKPHHLLLVWLAWDIGENIGTNLKLQKRDFVRQQNPHTGEPEYLVKLPREKLKRSRRSRTEPTLYQETVQYADMVLRDLKDDDLVFPFGYRAAKKLIERACKKTKAICLPHRDKITWKDLRSGMACHLLKNGWNRDEVNARLGHVPSSDILDAYINYLALDRHRPKQRLNQNRMENVNHLLQESKSREQFLSSRVQSQETENNQLRQQIEETSKDVEELKALLHQVVMKNGFERSDTKT